MELLLVEAVLSSHFDKVQSISKLANQVVSIVFGLVLIWAVIYSAYELVRRALKPNEVYACKIRAEDENGKSLGTPDLISIRVFWPISITSLWVKHSGWATVGEDKIPIVYEGNSGHDHVLRGVDFDNKIYLSIDRVTGKVVFTHIGTFSFEGTCLKRT